VSLKPGRCPQPQGFFLFSWTLEQRPQLRVQIYDNRGEVHEPSFALRLTYKYSDATSDPPPLYYATLESLGEGLGLLIASPSSNVTFVLRDPDSNQLRPSRLDAAQPRPLAVHSLPYSLGPMRAADLGDERGKRLLMAGAYGDLAGLLDERAETSPSNRLLRFDEAQMAACDVIHIFQPLSVLAASANGTAPPVVLAVNGSVTVNATGCVFDFAVVDWDGDGWLVRPALCPAT
jgi:hypothetical protein